MSGNQSALTAFQDATHEQKETTADEPATEPTPESTTTSAGSTTSSNPLDPLYEEVEAEATRIPDPVHGLDVTVPLAEPPESFITNNVPDEVAALPVEVGNWEVATAGDDHVIYGVDGKAYDERWGSGGGVERVRVYLNDSGANRDDLYSRCNETVIGYENSNQVRNTDLDETGPLIGVRGHSPQNNEGDYAVLSGTKKKTETMNEAVIDLLVYLHFTPVPLVNYVPTDPDTVWELTKLSITGATWKAPAPAKSPKETLALSINDTTLRLYAYNEEDSGPDRHRSPTPTLGTIPESVLPDVDTITELPALSAGIPIVTEVVTSEPSVVFDASSLPSR